MTPLFTCFLLFTITITSVSCLLSDTTKAVSTWSAWSTWSDCSESCGLGSRFRARHCDGGNDCIGDVFQQSSCDNHCILPIDGSWSGWTGWGDCSATCGDGVHFKTRTCTNPAPKNGGKDCEGRQSDGQGCNVRECPIDGGWSKYVDRPCTATCGTGVLVSIRHCDNPAPQYGGKECAGSSTKFDKCTLDACVIDGGWSSWTDFTNCTVVCGEGHIRRIRQCNSPKPSGGGADCAGLGEDINTCTSGQCPKDINICDKTLSTATVCANNPDNNGPELLKANCKFPDDISKWYFGLKVAGNCDILPLYIPVASMDHSKTIKYGMMTDCFNDEIKIISSSCDNIFITEAFNLTNYDFHLVTYHGTQQIT